MDVDTKLRELAHELWAIAQGKAPICDVVEPMIAELRSFAESLRSTQVMSTTKDGWPVHPTTTEHGGNSGVPGMTLRQWYAGMALQGMLSSGFCRDLRCNSVAMQAYDYADAMLAARKS
jgi:hypothetical protein